MRDPEQLALGEMPAHELDPDWQTALVKPARNGKRRQPGERIAVAEGDTPALAGTVVRYERGRLALLLDEPAGGTAFLACEAMDDRADQPLSAVLCRIAHEFRLLQWPERRANLF